jgi:hypothetical protein
MKEPERAIQPFPAPPLPSVALALSGPRPVAPNLQMVLLRELNLGQPAGTVAGNPSRSLLRSELVMMLAGGWLHTASLPEVQQLRCGWGWG